MFQFIDARLQPAPAEVTNGFVHKERPKGLREGAGGWGQGQSLHQSPAPGLETFPKEKSGPEKQPWRGVSVPAQKKGGHIPGEEWPCLGSGAVIGKVPMCWE